MDQATTDKNWWVSWVFEGDIEFEYHGPWWISGYSLSEYEDNPVICAAVTAPDEDAAKEVVRSIYDKEPQKPLRFRFVRELAGSPFNSRFQRESWMKWPVNV